MKRRDEDIAGLRADAAAFFAARPELNSLLLSVAQYWNDSADDECHSFVLGSTRAVPVWPHECERYHEEIWDDERRAFVANPDRRAGELCTECGSRLPDVYLNPFAWEQYCPEHANQDMGPCEAGLPYALFRRGAAGTVDVEIIGSLVRPHAEEFAPAVAGLPWSAKTRELFDLVRAAPADDGPRAVLADHLQLAGDPRGEYIALALTGAAPAREAELLAAHRLAWLGPLAPVLAPDEVAFRRGFLARATVYCKDELPRELADEPAWGTVEVLRRSPGSHDAIVPAMSALREVGPVGERGLAAIVEAIRPWRITRLWLDTSPPRACATLPALRELVLEDWALEDCDLGWWRTRERLTVITREFDVARWAARARTLGVPWVAVTQRGALDEPAGWQVAFGPDGAIEIAMAGWHHTATYAALVDLVAALGPAGARARLVSSPYRIITDEDRAELADALRSPAG